MGCQVWGSTVCSCHFSVGLFLFPSWPMAEEGPWARQQPRDRAHHPKCGAHKCLAFAASAVAFDPVHEPHLSVHELCLSVQEPPILGVHETHPLIHESPCFGVWVLPPHVPLGDLMSLLCQDPTQICSLTQLCLLSSSRQFYLRTPEVLCHCCCCHPRAGPSDPNQPWKLLNAAGHGCDAHLSVTTAPSFPQLLTPEGVMNLGRDQCSALSQALF